MMSSFNKDLPLLRGIDEQEDLCENDSTDTDGWEDVPEKLPDDLQPYFEKAKKGIKSQGVKDLVFLKIFREALRLSDISLIKILLSWGVRPDRFRSALRMLSPRVFTGALQSYQEILKALDAEKVNFMVPIWYSKETLLDHALENSASLYSEPLLLAILNRLDTSVLDQKRISKVLRHASASVFDSYIAHFKKNDFDNAPEMIMTSPHITISEAIRRIEKIGLNPNKLELDDRFCYLASSIEKLHKTPPEEQAHALSFIESIFHQSKSSFLCHKSPDGSTARGIIHLIENQQYVLVKTLVLSFPELVHFVDNEQKTCLHAIIPFLEIPHNVPANDIFLFLIEHGCNFSAKFQGVSVQHALFQRDLASVIKTISHEKYDFSELDNKGNTLIHHAVRNGNSDLLKWSLTHLESYPDKASILDTQNKKQKTAIQIAVERGFREIILLLRNSGCDTEAAEYSAISVGDATSYQLLRRDLPDRQLTEIFLNDTKIEAMPSIRFLQIYHQSSLGDSKKILNGLRERLQNETIWQTAWENMLKWSMLTTRYRTDSKHGSVITSYSNGYTNYFINQKNFGETFLETVQKAQELYHQKNWKLINLLEYFVCERKAFQASQQPGQLNKYGNWRSTKVPSAPRTSIKTHSHIKKGTRDRSRYFTFLPLIRKLFNELKENDFTLTDNRKCYQFKFSTTQNDIPVSSIRVRTDIGRPLNQSNELIDGGIYWYHAESSNLDKLLACISELHEAIMSMKYAQNGKELIDLMSDAYYGMNSGTFTERGWSSVSNMWLLFVKLETGVPIGPPKQCYPELSCVALSTTQEQFRELFFNLFEYDL